MNKGIDFTGLSVTMLCHDGRGNMLIHQRTNQCRDEHGCWDFGGGGIKFGESIEAAVTRELKEEYMTEPLELEFLGHRELFRVMDGVQTHWVTFDFKILVDPEKVSLGEPDKAENLSWVRLGALPAPLHSAIPEMLHQRKHHFE